MKVIDNKHTKAKSKRKDRGFIKATVTVEAFEPCPIHGPLMQLCDCPKKKTCTREKGDICLLQMAQVLQLNIFATNITIKDTSGSSHAETANTSSGTVKVAAGTGTTDPQYNDFALETPIDTPGTATIGSITGVGAITSFNITGSMIAGASRTYTELGLQVTINSHVYLLCRDTISGVPVSSGGTLNIKYAFTLG